MKVKGHDYVTAHVLQSNLYMFMCVYFMFTECTIFRMRASRAQGPKCSHWNEMLNRMNEC